MKTTAAIALVLGLCLWTGSALAGTISPGLADLMRGLSDDDELKVLVVLQDQADIPTLDQQLHERQAPMAERHRLVIQSLQDAASRSQGALLADLAGKRGTGEIRGWTAHWLINGVVVKGTVRAIRELAARPDIESVEPDLVVDVIKPVDRSPSKPGKSGEKGIGMTDGLRAIQADRVWNELGVTGVGAIVGHMDTGVDGTHPALSSNWRGNFAPASECWLDVLDLGHTTPQDDHYHGTHVMGTICGLAPDDTIGVAPGATWIASNAINQSTGTEFDNDVIASLEWYADPDGDPGTNAEVPDVIQNSWGVNENFSGYFDCDSRWWTAIDNCEAAGCVLTWSAGNEGPGSTSLRSPADRADTPTNCFSVGSTIRTPPYTISSFSSRGPSGCGGAYAMKPEVSAPGEDIYSAQPGGGYQYLSGTSMAGPHVAGVVGLMRSANPNVDVITIKEILMSTSTDLGSAGEDNTYGHGLINAYEAVLAVMGGLGSVEGTVTDVSTGLPIEGALVKDVGGYNSQSTDDTGYYDMILTAEEHTLEFSAFGYYTDTAVITVLEDLTVVVDMALTPQPTALLHGHVYDPDSLVVAGATITVLETPVAPATSSGTGYYELTLPVGDTYEVRARAPGLGADQHTVVFDVSTEQDFYLPILSIEDFETGDFVTYPWEMSGNADWVIDTADPYEGAYCAKSGTISDNQESVLAVALEVVADGNISFYYKVSSESSYDYLRFLIDGSEVVQWSGAVGWTLASYPVTSGPHTFTWKYTKDGSVSSGSDAGWIDFVEFPTIGPPAFPRLFYTPSNLNVTLPADQTVAKPITLMNVGEAELDYLVTLSPVAKTRPVKPVAMTPALELGKDEPDLRSGRAPDKGQGGPDIFGYNWIDSDEPGGPVYKWNEINSVGTPVGNSDDASYGPFSLGFSFPYYGNLFTEVRICTNGFLSFTSSSSRYTNDPIPSGGDPNNLLAPFWDDLDPGSGGTIYYYQDATNQQFIVEYDGVHHYPSGNPETFQAIIRADGTILYQYKTMDLTTGCTVGIEDQAGTDGLQVVYNASYLHSDMAILFSSVPPVPWLTVEPIFGNILPAASDQLLATFDATDLTSGVYQAEIHLATNDPEAALVVIPVTLTVDDLSAAGDSGLPRAFALGTARPNPFNPATYIPFSLPRTERVELKVYDVAGRLVRTLVSGPYAAGHHQVFWDGRDGAGRNVASGTYYARLTAGRKQFVKPLVLVR